MKEPEPPGVQGGVSCSQLLSPRSSVTTVVFQTKGRVEQLPGMGPRQPESTPCCYELRLRPPSTVRTWPLM